MNQFFEEIKQRYPKTVKALGITADMDYEEWCEVYHRKALQEMMKPLPVDISGLKDQVLFPWSWYSHLMPQLQSVNQKE
jgi:hypothetical protein